jgi:hypothetical protein
MQKATNKWIKKKMTKKDAQGIATSGNVLRSKLASRANCVEKYAAAAAVAAVISAGLISAGGAAAALPLTPPSTLALEAALAASPDAADAALVSADEAKAKSEFIDEGRTSAKLSGVSVAISGTSAAHSSSASARYTLHACNWFQATQR